MTAQALTPRDVSPNSQYDDDSAPNQRWNCGPTSITNILKYMQDRDYPINETRRLATTKDGTGTTLAERKVMLSRRGTPCDIHKLSPDEVKARLTNRCSIDIALLMSVIPLVIRVRPFDGRHSVTAIAKGTGLCLQHKQVEDGIWVDNPDFHPERGQHARYFYPDHAWIPAFNALGGWVLIPDKDKVIVTRFPLRKRFVVLADLRARTGPGTGFTKIKVLPRGTRFTSTQIERAGGWYIANKQKRRDWLSLVLNGRVVWVARAYVKEV